MLKFKKENIYDLTANYIFSLSKSKVLDLEKLTILFQKNNFNPPDSSIIESLQKYYQTKDLTQKNVKPVDLNSAYNEHILEENLKAMYKDDKNNINSNLLIKDLKEIEPNFDYSLFDEFLNYTLNINSTDENTIDNLYLYIKLNFFITTNNKKK